MNQPLDISNYVSLVVTSPLSEDQQKVWFRCVSEQAPSGVVQTLQCGNGEELRSVSMVARKTGDNTAYMVPMTRSLAEREVERIVEAYKEACTDDFDIEATTVPQGSNMSDAGPTLDIEEEQYKALCAAWAKRKHNDWVRSRTEQGWRYGQRVSMKDKTHPLLRPWDDLPASARATDMDEPQELLDLIDSHGYVVVTKSDLETLMGLVRRSNK